MVAILHASEGSRATFWEAVDTMPTLPRITAPRCSLHKVIILFISILKFPFSSCDVYNKWNIFGSVEKEKPEHENIHWVQ